MARSLSRNWHVDWLEKTTSESVQHSLAIPTEVGHGVLTWILGSDFEARRGVRGVCGRRNGSMRRMVAIDLGLHPIFWKQVVEYQTDLTFG